jgi:hypothetical protein
MEVSDFEGNSLEFWAPGCCTFTASYPPVASAINYNGITVTPYSGNYMVALTLQGAAFDGGNDADTALFQYDKSSEIPLPNFQNRTIIVHAWIPDYFTNGPYVIQIFFIGGGTNSMWHSEWIFLQNFSPSYPTYVDSPVLETVKPNAWNTLYYPITPSDQGYADAAQVDSYGIQLMQNGGANSVVPGEAIYVDDILVQ